MRPRIYARSGGNGDPGPRGPPGEFRKSDFAQIPGGVPGGPKMVDFGGPRAVTLKRGLFGHFWPFLALFGVLRPNPQKNWGLDMKISNIPSS